MKYLKVNELDEGAHVLVMQRCMDLALIVDTLLLDTLVIQVNPILKEHAKHAQRALLNLAKQIEVVMDKKFPDDK